VIALDAEVAPVAPPRQFDFAVPDSHATTMMTATELPHPPHHEDLLQAQLSSFLDLIDPEALQALRARLSWCHLSGGEPLMRQGDAGDALYMLVSGRLRVYIDDEDGERRMVREIARGEVVGEMALFTGEPRSATLVALRDSVLVKLHRDDFQALVASNPAVTIALTRQVITRLQTERSRTVIDKPVTMALVPVTAGVDAALLAQRLASALAEHGRVAVVDAARSAALVDPARSAALVRSGSVDDDPEDKARRMALWLDEIESRHDYLLLVGDDTASEWTGLCVRHADEILLLADATAEPALHDSERRFLVERPARTEAAEILLLLHPPGKAMPRNTSAWLARRPLAGHVHLRVSEPRDIARLARIQSRSAVGLVLAGGGARGLAHLGVMRALEERGIEVDFVGGTSSGALVGFLAASGLPFAEADTVAAAAARANPTGDFSLLPLLSLIRGRRMRRVIGEAIERSVGRDVGIEDLWKPFFCVASNYSQASEMVLDRGPLLQSLLASVAIPGALPPVLRDGELLCDGGTFNNFPVDVMRRQRGVSRVIGVDLGGERLRHIDSDEVPGGWALLRDRLRPRKSRRYRLPGLATLLINATILYSVSRQKQAHALTDLYFRPPLKRVGMLDWSRYAELVRQGYEHACAVLDGTAEPRTAAAAAPVAQGTRSAPAVGGSLGPAWQGQLR